MRSFSRSRIPRRPENALESSSLGVVGRPFAEAAISAVIFLFLLRGRGVPFASFASAAGPSPGGR